MVPSAYAYKLKFMKVFKKHFYDNFTFLNVSPLGQKNIKNYPKAIF